MPSPPATGTPTPADQARGHAPFSRRAAGAVELLLAEARPLILDVAVARSCVGSTRVAVDYLRECGVRARPLSARLRVYSPAYTALLCAATLDEGCAAELHRLTRNTETLASAGLWSIGIGYSREADDVIPERGWDGHLVCVVEDRAILDLSLDQASRPAHLIELGPTIVPSTCSWLRGEVAGEVVENGCLLAYTAQPNDRSYLAGRDWCEPQRWAGVLSELRALSEGRSDVRPSAGRRIDHVSNPPALSRMCWR